MKICTSPGLVRHSAMLRGGALMKFFVKQEWSHEGPSGSYLKLKVILLGINLLVTFGIWRLNRGASPNHNSCRERGIHCENDYSCSVNTFPSGCVAYLAV